MEKNTYMDIALIGLGVMGKNIVLNFISKQYKVSVYNRTSQRTDEFIAEAKLDTSILKPCYSFEELVMSLKRPRVIIVMVSSGKPVDDILSELMKYLERSDVVIEMGNSHYKDTIKRCDEYRNSFSFIGCGISGGEEGARKGPSLMPGGDSMGWDVVKDMLQSVSAKYEDNRVPCCEWIGESGSGHFVKMIHNGIEYGDMAIIAEIYCVMKNTGLTNEEISERFKEFNEAKELRGNLTEIIQNILTKKEGGEYVIDKIEDRAENKGTGLWSITAAINCQYHCTLMAEAVFSRMISYEKDKRVKFAKIKKEPLKMKVSIDDMKRAMILTKAISYVQGLSLIKRMSDLNNWNLCLASICRVWRSGCIIRSAFLEIIEEIVKEDDYENSTTFVKIYKQNIDGLRNVVIECVRAGHPSLALTSCLTYLDALGTERGNGNVIQALRDFFGAHKVTFVGEKEAKHVNW